jgi:hypothetical protein
MYAVKGIIAEQVTDDKESNERSEICEQLAEAKGRFSEGSRNSVGEQKELYEFICVMPEKRKRQPGVKDRPTNDVLRSETVARWVEDFNRDLSKRVAGDEEMQGIKVEK